MDFDKAYDLLDNVRERLETTIPNSLVDLMPSDTDDFFITVTQRNETTGNDSKWSFCVDFGINKVQMLEPTEDEESFGNANEVFGVIKNFLNGGMSREKRFGNKIGSSNKTVVRQGPNLKTLDETPPEHIMKNLDAYKGYTRYDMEELVLNPSGYILYDASNNGRDVVYKKHGATKDDDDIILYFRNGELKNAEIKHHYDNSVQSSRKPIKSGWERTDMASGPIWDKDNWRIIERRKHSANGDEKYYLLRDKSNLSKSDIRFDTLAEAMDHVDLRIQSSRKSIKSSKYIVEVGNDEIKFDNIKEANETFRQAVENNDINTSIKIYVDEGYSNKHLKLMRSERGKLTSSRKPIKSAKTICKKGSAKLIEHCEAGDCGYLGRYTIIINGEEVFHFTAENRREAVCSFNNYLDHKMNNNITNSRKSIKSSLSGVNKALGFTDNDVEEDGKIHITTDLGEFVVDYVNDEYIVSYDGEERTFTEYKDTVEEVVDLFNKLCNEEVELFNKNINSSKSIKSSHDRETLQKVIRAYLDKMGYKDVEGGVDAAADYILQNEEYYPDYDLHLKVKKWFNDTKENYPETLIKASRTIKSSFTQDELNCLREMIVDGMDERFYDWYSEKYGDEPWKASNEQMAEWIKSDPEITKEYSDYLEREMPYYEPGHDEKYVNEFLNSSHKPIKSSTDHINEYIASDSFAESGAFQDYITDKLFQKGFSSEEIEYGWNDSPVKEAREEIEKNYSVEDYVNWAKDYIAKDKYKMMWYKDWLMANGYPVEEEPLTKQHSFDPANNTWPGPSY